jgi:hypothetical protein
MKLDVLSAVHLIVEPWRLITPTTLNNCSVNCSFSIDHVSSNHDRAVKLNKGEVDDWHSSEPLGVQSEEYITCDSALKICGVQNVNQVLLQHLIRLEEEEIVKHKAALLVALKGLETARKYIHQFDTKNNITVMCNKGENELYILTAQGEKKQKTG